MFSGVILNVGIWVSLRWLSFCWVLVCWLLSCRVSDVHLNEQFFYCNAECHILKVLSWAMMSVILQSVVMLRVITLSVIQCQWGFVTHKMAVPVPSISCCVFNYHNKFYQVQNALAFNRDMCCHQALSLRLLPFH
jgi:hypothetical protein